MIELYYAPTANGRRAAIILAEAELPHQVHHVKFDAKPAQLLKLNPSGNIPVIVDAQGPGGEPIVLAQSGAIMNYVAEKSGRFWPADTRRRWVAQQWFTQALSDVSGASNAFFTMQHDAPEKSEANGKFLEQRLFTAFSACDRQLAQHEYLADEISLADFALFPFVNARWAVIERAGGLPSLARWRSLIAARPGVARAMALS